MYSLVKGYIVVSGYKGFVHGFRVGLYGSVGLAAASHNYPTLDLRVARPQSSNIHVANLAGYIPNPGQPKPYTPFGGSWDLVSKVISTLIGVITLELSPMII